MKRQKGFTLMEVVLAVSLSFVVVLSVFTFFTQGIRFFERVYQTSPIDEASLLFERIAADLRNSVYTDAAPLIAAGNQLSFVTLKTQGEPTALSLEQFEPMVVEYEWDRKQLKITRSQRPLEVSGKASSKQVSLEGVALFRVEQKGMQRPLPGRITIFIDLNRGTKTWNFKKHMTLPVGYAFSD